MARYAYDRLTALDNSFLILENQNSYMHVASTQIFEVGPLRTKSGGVDAERIKQAHRIVCHVTQQIWSLDSFPLRRSLHQREHVWPARLVALGR